MMKRCPACERELPPSSFGRNKTRPDGLSFYCLDCNRQRAKRWYRQHRRRLGKEVRDHSWIPDGFRWCPSCRQAVPHEDYVRNGSSASGFGSRCKPCDRTANSEGYFYRRYKLTPRELAELRAAQGDVCGICGEGSPQHLDHDHSTGQIRQLLCQRCNQGLGLFRDDPYLLQVAALYVIGHQEQHVLAELLAASNAPAEGATRPGDPPVGSQRRPGARGTSSRSTGRTSRSRRQTRAGEADG